MDGTGERHGPSIPMALGLTLLAQLVFVGLAALLFRVSRHEWVWAGLAPELSLLFIAAAGIIAGTFTAGVVLLAYRFIPAYARSLAEVMRLMRVFSPGVMLIMAIPSAFGEEVLFRGAVQTLAGPLPAAILFGLAHTAGKRTYWSYGLTAAVAGYLFGLAYQYTGELWVPVLAHAVYNALVTAILNYTSLAGVD